jgi:hypothetical protein
MTGGVNLHADPTQIRDDQLAYAKNLVPVRPGVIGSRPCMQWAREAMQPNLGFGSMCVLRAMFSPIGPELSIVYWDIGNNELRFNLFDDSVARNDSKRIVIANNCVPVSMVQWDGDTYVFTGETRGARAAFASNSDGFVVEAINWSDAGNENFKPTGAAVIRDRMVYWGYGDGREVMFADRGKPLQIGANAVASGRSIPVALIAQSPITHCQELVTSNTGSPNQSVVAVWTTDSMYMLLGEPAESFDPGAVIGSLQQNLLPVNAGCVSGATVASTPYGTIWAGPDDVWFMPFGSTPIRIGTNIRPALLETPPNLRWKWHGVYDPNTSQYRLAIFGPGAGPTEISGCTHHYILDMSQSPPRDADSAVWWGPQVYNQVGGQVCNGSTTAGNPGPGTQALAVDLGDDGDRQVYGVQFYYENTSDASEFVAGCSLTLLNVNGSRDSAAPNRDLKSRVAATEYFIGDEIIPYDEVNGTCRPYIWKVTAVNGAGPGGGGVTGAGAVSFNVSPFTMTKVDGGVTWTATPNSGVFAAPGFLPVSQHLNNEVIIDLLTKEYTWDPMLEKLVDGAELSYWADKSLSLNYSFLTDFEENARVLEIEGDELGFARLGTASGVTARGQRIWSTRLLPMDPTNRFIAKSVQMRIQQNVLFPVTDGNRYIPTLNELGESFVVSVAKGSYDYDTLMQEVADALQTGLSLSPFQFITAEIANGSLEGLGNGGSSFGFFVDASTNASVAPVAVATAAQYKSAARLFSLFGFNTAPGFFRISQDGLAYTKGSQSNARTRDARIIISKLNIRAREFGRRPL